MKFFIDKQTLNDLDLLEKSKGEPSVFSCFNHTKSIGGKKKLAFMFSHPMTDPVLIENRLNSIRKFKQYVPEFEIDKESLDFIEYYLYQQNIPNRFSYSKSIAKALGYKIKPQNEYYIIQRGIRYLIVLLNELFEFSQQLQHEESISLVKSIKDMVSVNLENSGLNIVLGYKHKKKFYPHEFGKLDHCFRRAEVLKVRELLDIIYEIDVYQSFIVTMEKHKFTLPEITPSSKTFQAEGIFHPFLDRPVENDFAIVPNSNVCFLTGPNMAGKSTFLKAVSIAVYLTHLGFPVPARNLKTSVFQGLLTTINLSDNTNKGYSHFYNEVLRVRYVAEMIKQHGSIFVVFDELFRGTNVKDAFEASLAVTLAFSKLNAAFFAISTHIIEVGDELKDSNAIFFRYFEANLIDGIPQYNYKLKEGITDERIGMYILKKEKVIETIEASLDKKDERYVHL